MSKKVSRGPTRFKFQWLHRLKSLLACLQCRPELSLVPTCSTPGTKRGTAFRLFCRVAWRLPGDQSGTRLCPVLCSRYRRSRPSLFAQRRPRKKDADTIELCIARVRSSVFVAREIKLAISLAGYFHAQHHKSAQITFTY